MKTQTSSSNLIYEIIIFICILTTSILIANRLHVRLNNLNKAIFFIELENIKSLSKNNILVNLKLDIAKATQLLQHFTELEIKNNQLDIQKLFITPTDLSLLKITIYGNNKLHINNLANKSISYLKENISLKHKLSTSNLNPQDQSKSSIYYYKTMIKEPGISFSPTKVSLFLLVTLFFFAIYFTTLIIKIIYARK